MRLPDRGTISLMLRIERALPQHAPLAAALLKEAALWLVEIGQKNWEPEWFVPECFAENAARGELWLGWHEQGPVATMLLLETDPDFWPKDFPGEALLVVPDTKDATNFRVVEGSRRLTAVKLLLHPELAPIRKSAVAQASAEAKFRPTELPTLVFAKQQDILTILGQCACTEDWVSKQHSSSYAAWNGKLSFTSLPCNMIFIPFCFRDSS